MAEVRLSSGENETAPNCSTWIGSSSAGKEKTDIHKSVVFAAKYCGFQSSRTVYVKLRITGTFFIKGTVSQIFPANFDAEGLPT